MWFWFAKVVVFLLFFFFFFNDTATTEIYTLSLHDALPTSASSCAGSTTSPASPGCRPPRSEEHTSELQSRQYLVCRLLLEKKKKIKVNCIIYKKKNKNKQSRTKKTVT